MSLPFRLFVDLPIDFDMSLVDTRSFQTRGAPDHVFKTVRPPFCVCDWIKGAAEWVFRACLKGRCANNSNWAINLYVSISMLRHGREKSRWSRDLPRSQCLAYTSSSVTGTLSLWNVSEESAFLSTFLTLKLSGRDSHLSPDQYRRSAITSECVQRCEIGC